MAKVGGGSDEGDPKSLAAEPEMTEPPSREEFLSALKINPAPSSNSGAASRAAETLSAPPEPTTLEAVTEDPLTGQIERRLSKIVQGEDPPASPEDALVRWQKAKASFQAALGKSRAWRQSLEALRGDLAKLPSLVAAVEAAALTRKIAAQAEQEAAAAKQNTETTRAEAQRRQQEAELGVSAYRVDRPGFWARLFGARSRPFGVPLLVHRRCAEPMFGVSNEVAYADLMVQAKQPKPSRIREVLGPSAWLHMESTSAEDKWSAAEGEIVIELLRWLAADCVSPNLYVISPFVIVADRLRQAIRANKALEGWIADDDFWRWTNERIGTVHTVQGREAEAVFFVLGAPMPAQAGARCWAGARPNLLNVAVTRAQEALYVIGNRGLWRDAGYFRVLDRRMAEAS